MTVAEHQPSGLRARSVGLPGALFQSITSMAPGAGVAFSLLVAVPAAGPALPLAVALALGACVLVANAVGQLARQIPSAGGLYAYLVQSLGPGWGFLAGWVLLLCQPIAAPALILVFAAAVQEVGGGPWWIWVVVAAALVLVAGYRDVRLSTRVGVGLGLVEITVFVALALWMIIARLGANTFAAFDPARAPQGALTGTFTGMVFAILAFLGFEAAAPLGEEAYRPRRTIPRAVVCSALAIGVFYVLCAYAWVIGTGPAQFVALTTAADNPDPWRRLATTFWGPGWVVVFLAVVNSAFASANAGALAASRLGYALGRAGVLPRVLGRAHPRFRTPYVAVVAQAAFGVVVAVVTGVLWGPQTAFVLLATLATILVILLYIAVCVGSIRYYRRRPDFHPLLHGALPTLGAAVLVGPLYVEYATLPDPPIRYANWGALGWLALGIGVTAWMWRCRRPLLVDAARLAAGGSAAAGRNTGVTVWGDPGSAREGTGGG
jgi:amino acid transporter